MLIGTCILSVVVGIWLVHFLHEVEHGYNRSEIDRQLDSYRATEDELIDWDRHTSGGRRG
jgi:hypothetical protein